MVIRIPDGRGFALSYPSSLQLAGASLTAGGEIAWVATKGPDQCCSSYVAPYYGAVDSIFTGKPLAVSVGAKGAAVPYYSGNQAAPPFRDPAADYLAFTFGPWVVLVRDAVRSGDYTARMTEGERTVWARSFDAHITKGGFLVYSPRPPLRVHRGAVDVVLNAKTGLIEIAGPQACAATRSEPQDFAGGRAWCDRKADAHVSFTGTPGFVDLASLSVTLKKLAPIN